MCLILLCVGLRYLFWLFLLFCAGLIWVCVYFVNFVWVYSCLALVWLVYCTRFGLGDFGLACILSMTCWFGLCLAWCCVFGCVGLGENLLRGMLFRMLKSLDIMYVYIYICEDIY